MEVARLEFPLLRTQAEFEAGAAPPEIQIAQEAIHWAEHLVIVYPLWLGTMPALLKGFLEQAFRPGFAFDPGAMGLWDKRPRAGQRGSLSRWVCRRWSIAGISAPAA